MQSEIITLLAAILTTIRRSYEIFPEPVKLFFIGQVVPCTHYFGARRAWVFKSIGIELCQAPSSLGSSVGALGIKSNYAM